jgi:hypothetical protein
MKALINTSLLQSIFDEERRAVLECNKDILQGLPVRTYLDQTIVPILLEGIKALVRERYPLHAIYSLGCMVSNRRNAILTNPYFA